MKKVFKLFKLVFVVAFIFGGWALAAASLHVVRAPGSMLWNKVPLNVQLVPKNSLTFKGTYIDTTKWTVADVESHADFVQRLRQANKTCLIEQAEKTPAPSQAQASAIPPVSSSSTLQRHAVIPSTAPPVSADPAPAPSVAAAPAPAKTEEPKPKSIFDFPNK